MQVSLLLIYAIMLIKTLTLLNGKTFCQKCFITLTLIVSMCVLIKMINSLSGMILLSEDEKYIELELLFSL